MLSHARRGACEIVAGAALWRCRCEIVAGAALWRCRCEIVAGAALWRNRGRRSTLAMPLRNRGRRSTLAMPLPKSWQAQHSMHLGVCLCGSGRIRQLSRGTRCCWRAAGGVRNRGRRSTLAMPLRNRGRRSTLAMPLPKSWQAQHSVHLGVCLCGRGRIRQLSRGTGCCRARGGGRAKSWQAQHFGDAVAEVVAGAAFCASGCSVIASTQGAHGTCVWTFELTSLGKT